MSRTIALLTDFGIRDHYVGVMKGVMRGICPEATFIDITHEVPAQAVRDGALTLRQSYRFFPSGTVFLAVVDPGVGSSRRALLVHAGEYTFVAPDNGVLSYMFAEFESMRAFALENPRLRLQQVSSTFHGRDIFAPAAAYAANGNLELEEFGPAVDPSTLVRLPAPRLELDATTVRGEVTRIDHFGNAITSIGPLSWLDDAHLQLASGTGLPQLNASRARITAGRHQIQGVKHAYHEVSAHEILAQIDSAGFLEIAVNQGSAAQELNLHVGDEILITHFASSG